MRKLHVIMELLADGSSLPRKYRDHALQGAWLHLRDCHIEGDWVLLYEISQDTSDREVVTFHATGTHEQLFG